MKNKFNKIRSRLVHWKSENIADQQPKDLYKCRDILCL